MKVLIRDGKNCYKAFWIKRSQKQIIGWYGGNLFGEIPFNDNLHRELHFNYPESGDFHYTISIFNRSNNEKEKEMHYYENKVDIKTFHPSISKYSAQVTNETRVPFFLPAFKQRPFSYYSEEGAFFQLPVIAVPSVSLNLDHPLLNQITVKKDDICIDIADLGQEGGLEVLTFLLGKKHTDLDLSKRGFNIYKVFKDYNSIPEIEVYAIILPPNSERNLEVKKEPQQAHPILTGGDGGN